MLFSSKILEEWILPAGDWLLGQQFVKHLKRLRQEVHLSGTELDRLQKERLKSILDYAVKAAPYYRSLDIESNSDPELYLRSFPILDKKILRAQQLNLLTKPQQKLLRQSSSGSSGVQSVTFGTKEEQSIHRATQILWWEWAGYELGMPIVQSGITPNRGFIKSIKDKLLNTHYLVAFAPDKDAFVKALTWASQQKKVFLGGYASSLFVLSQVAKEYSFKVNFHGAVSWGDKLFDHYKHSIETAFGTKVKETYGAAEGLMMAAQKDLPYMYIMTPNVYLEILDEAGNEVPDGQIGHVVVTSLVVKGMPLIRYKIGDLAIKLPMSEYPKERELALPLLKKVIGRDTDLVKTPSGKYMVVHTFTGIFEHYPEIEQFCVIQEDLNGILIQYIPRAEFHADILNEILSKIQFYLNEPEFQIGFKQVSNIPSTPSGKPQIIISKLK